MKKILEIICGLSCLVCLVLAGGENPDGSCNLVWTLSFLALAVFFGWALGKLSKTPRRYV